LGKADAAAFRRARAADGNSQNIFKARNNEQQEEDF